MRALLTRSNGMEDELELVLSTKQQTADQIAVTVLGGLAGLAASKLVERGYKGAMTAYRIKKATA